MVFPSCTGSNHLGIMIARVGTSSISAHDPTERPGRWQGRFLLRIFRTTSSTCTNWTISDCHQPRHEAALVPVTATPRCLLSRTLFIEIGDPCCRRRFQRLGTELLTIVQVAKSVVCSGHEDLTSPAG